MIFTLENAKVRYPGQGTVYLEEPAGRPVSAVVAVHGSGRGALDYRDTPFYREQRDIALRHGCVFAVVSNGPDTWGTDPGLYNLDLLVDTVLRRYALEKVILWPTSAGGVTANRMVRAYPRKIAFVIGTFPVYDLASVFHLNSCKKAWGTDRPETFLERIEAINPARFPEALKGHRYYITHGSADQAVPAAENAVRMAEDLGENVTLEIVPGGVHTTADLSYYGSAVEKAFSELKKSGNA